MRQGKLSELIHNSQGHSEDSDEEEDFCSVEVWFREIIDLVRFYWSAFALTLTSISQPGPDAFEVVPNSRLIVARTAYRNNTSKYTINSKPSNFTEVTTLLKARGIDLDHKRFLILQVGWYCVIRI